MEDRRLKTEDGRQETDAGSLKSFSSHFEADRREDREITLYFE
ncbi:hypothetical protein [Galbibacter mesophilus]|nr:hypothetical protein [Galbibacter mesophilus]